LKLEIGVLKLHFDDLRRCFVDVSHCLSTRVH
jgi:hypothetical protein